MATPKIGFEITADGSQAEQAVRSLLGTAKTVGAAVAGALTGAGAGAAAIAGFTATVAKAADDLGDFAGEIGISTEALTQYHFIAGQAGITADKLDASFARMTRSIAEAAKGTGTAGNALRELGLDAKALANLSPDQQFEVIADALSKVEKSGDKARLSFQIFGKAGRELTRIMGDGAEGLRQARERADELGFSLGEKASEQFGKTADALDTMSEGFTAAGRIIAGYFAPQVEVFARGVGELMPRAAKVAVAALEQLKATLTKGAAAVASFFGANDTAEALRDQAAIYETAVADLAEEIDGYKSTVRDATVDTSKFIGESLGPMADETKRAKEAQKELNAELQKAASYFDATRTPLEAYEIKLRELEELKAKGRITFEVYARAALQAEIAADEALDKLNDPEKARQEKARSDLASKVAKYYNDTRTAAEKLEATQSELNDLYKQGAIDFEVYARAGLQAEIAAEEALSKAADGTTASQRKIEQYLSDIKGELNSFADDIVDAFTRAGDGIGKMFEDLALSIAKYFFKKTVIEPAVDAFSGFVKGLFGGTGKAVGGPLGDRPTLVGERGPEVVDGAGNVHANESLGRMGANITFVINTLDPRTAAAVIAENRDVIVGIVRQGMARAGNPVRIA